MTAKAMVAHQMPGRVRFSVPAKRGDVDYFQRLKHRFTGIDTVQRIKANPLAGSIVLEFGGSLETLLARLVEPDLFELADSLTDSMPDSLAHSMADARGNGAYLPLPAYPIHLVSGREINLTFMAGVVFAALGLLQGLRGRVMVPAVTAFWYATSTFQQASVAVALADEANSD
ncbi:MAG: hypothetical protein V4582_24390 [Pseudomonadota bacterium]